MSIVLDQDNTIFTIQEGSSIVVLDAAEPYLNYTASTLGKSATPPPEEGGLFTFTTEVIDFEGEDISYDVYDFMGNTIVYSGNSLTIEGIFTFDSDFARDIYVKNLNIEVSNGGYTTVRGYLLGTIDATVDVVTNIENCHLVFNLPGSVSVGGLIGNGFSSGDISGCSTTYSEGTSIPSLFSSSGAIIGASAGISNTGSLVTILIISKCYSTIELTDITGGISGTATGFVSSGTSSSVTISNCYSTGNIDNGSGGICGDDTGLINQNTVAPQISTVNISSCYSIGNINNSSGGICGVTTGIVLVAGVGSTDATSKITISDCYSTGNISDNSGGIVGSSSVSTNDALDAFITLAIRRCYSTGAIADVTSGGISASALASQAGPGIATIDCSYILNGVDPVDDGGDNYGSGNLLGTGSLLTNVASNDNSFTLVMDGDVSTAGRESLATVQTVCTGYSNVLRCVFTGAAPILTTFLNCEVWRIAFAGTGEEVCLELFAPTLGYCGCPLEISEGETWPQTAPGETASIPFTNKILIRECTALGVWGNVLTINCNNESGSGISNSQFIITISVMCTIFAAFIIIVVVFLRM